MLNHFVNPATISTGQPVEGVQAIQGYTPYNQIAKLVPAFKLPEEGGKPEDEDKKTETITLEELEGLETEMPEIFQLAVNVSFKEMLEYFFTPYEEEIFELRSKFREDRGVDSLAMFTPSSSVPGDFQELREELYEVQVQLFQSPRGLHCHIII
ncbi:MAG: hypothetical protein JJU46_13595 [Balneolaceae bacterium]|nr:hypothetical protein [Balneolaceae bacterium]MCH8548237.1 hypothetical protein [Balneolaceae bacterium]